VLASLSSSDIGLLTANALLFTTVGICGGYTTISSFTLQTLNLGLEGEWVRAALNVGGSVALCLLAAEAGHLLVLAIFQ
jgi:CrcB protein